MTRKEDPPFARGVETKPPRQVGVIMPFVLGCYHSTVQLFLSSTLEGAEP